MRAAATRREQVQLMTTPTPQHPKDMNEHDKSKGQPDKKPGQPDKSGPKPAKPDEGQHAKNEGHGAKPPQVDMNKKGAPEVAAKVDPNAGHKPAPR